MKLRTIFQLLFCSLFTTNLVGQDAMFDTLSFVRKTSNIIVIDSQYYLVVNLFVDGDQELRMKHKYHYEESIYANGSETIQFTKVIRGWSASVFSNSLRQPLYEDLIPNTSPVRKVNNKNPFSDTILLDNYIPLEIGDYFIYMNFSFEYNMVSYLTQYMHIPFKVEFIPPKSIYH